MGREEGGEKSPKQTNDLRFFDAPTVEEIAKTLIGQYHSHLQNVPIMYLFNAKMRDWASMSKRSNKEQFISGYKFVLEVNHKKWAEMSEKERTALVDHELCHAGIDLESGDPVIIDHDVEEFAVIVKRHGLWRDTVKHFGYACNERIQLSLMPDAA